MHVLAGVVAGDGAVAAPGADDRDFVGEVDEAFEDRGRACQSAKAASASPGVRIRA
jgi:hypothetical protein